MKYFTTQNWEYETGDPKIGKLIGHVSIWLIAFFTLMGCWTIISPGERGVVIQLGSVQDKIMTEGFNLKFPWLQKVKKLDVKTQKEEVGVSAASKDLQTVTTKIALNYHLTPDRVNKLWQLVGSEYKTRIIDPAIQEAVKASTAKFTAEELITKRSEVKEATKTILAERLAKEFIFVDELSIVDFDFSKSFNDAIEAKVTAEQNALAAKNKLEQVKFEAEQRISQAKGEAEAIRIQAQAIQAQGGADYVKLQWIKQWSGILPTTMLGDNTPLVNIN